jgi:hypothetical protein
VGAALAAPAALAALETATLAALEAAALVAKLTAARPKPGPNRLKPAAIHLEADALTADV